jgi:hypothetical protein
MCHRGATVGSVGARASASTQWGKLPPVIATSSNGSSSHSDKNWQPSATAAVMTSASTITVSQPLHLLATHNDMI